VLPPVTPITGIRIVGLPESLSYGQSIQLTAVVTLQSGIEKQTLDATWQSSDLNAAIVSETGLLEVTGFGEVNISATLQ
jgi:uncharacterized protein YjdB